MKLLIKGALTKETLNHAFKKIQEFCNSEGQNVIKGASIYFNAYNKETGEKVEFHDDQGRLIDKLVFDYKPAVKKEKIVFTKQAVKADKEVEKKLIETYEAKIVDTTTYEWVIDKLEKEGMKLYTKGDEPRSEAFGNAMLHFQDKFEATYGRKN